MIVLVGLARSVANRRRIQPVVGNGQLGRSVFAATRSAPTRPGTGISRREAARKRAASASRRYGVGVVRERCEDMWVLCAASAGDMGAVGRHR
jgi:hypothetical protein